MQMEEKIQFLSFSFPLLYQFTLWAALHTFVCLCFCVFVFLCIRISVCLHLCEFDTHGPQVAGWCCFIQPLYLLHTLGRAPYFCVSVFLCICVSVYLCFCVSAFVWIWHPWSSSGWMVLLYPASVSTSHFGPRSILDDLPVYERQRQMTTSKQWYEKKEWQHTLKPDKVISYEWMMLGPRLLESLGRSTVALGLP